MENMYLDNSANNSTLAIETIEKGFDDCSFKHALTVGNVLKRQAAILSLDEIKSEEEADLLIDNLTGEDGRIREVSAFKIHQFMCDVRFVCFFQKQEYNKVFIDAICDINPTICRFIIDILPFICEKEIFINRIFEKISIAIEELKKYTPLQRYETNRQTFKIYWLLEALSNLIDSVVENEEFVSLISQCGRFEDYTIKEKVAKILSLMNSKNSKLVSVTNELTVCDNFYVRRYFSNY